MCDLYYSPLTIHQPLPIANEDDDDEATGFPLLERSLEEPKSPVVVVDGKKSSGSGDRVQEN